MTQHNFLQNRKGQSAIEYLMTYGWMLLVVAIVGGAIFATVQSNNQGCSTEIPMALDAQQQGFGVTNFGAEPGNTQVVLQNNGNEPAEVNNVTVNANGNVVYNESVGSVGASGSETVEFGTINGTDQSLESADSCNDVTISINYDMGGLTGQTMEGNLTAQLS